MKATEQFDAILPNLTTELLKVASPKFTADLLVAFRALAIRCDHAEDEVERLRALLAECFECYRNDWMTTGQKEKFVAAGRWEGE
jgi:hypothetical protein